jgi:uroporphyrin-III C-methyltransferase/precorrin-2 dehydrogenase/sirohydrochlorin ferrochelatase
MRQITPRETRAPRMRPLAVLPVFIDMAGKRAVVAGGGEAAVWKAELLAAVGARVEVLAPDPCAELDALSLAPTAGSVAVARRRWCVEDLAGAALAIGALSGEEAALFAAAARRHGVPVNVIDTPGLSDFSFGSIVNRSPVVIGISTGGSAPVLGQAIRAKIEALLHPALGTWASAARRVRAAVTARLPMGSMRRDVWRGFAERALTARVAPSEDDLRNLA